MILVFHVLDIFVRCLGACLLYILCCSAISSFPPLVVGIKDMIVISFIFKAVMHLNYESIINTRNLQEWCIVSLKTKL